MSNQMDNSFGDGSEYAKIDPPKPSVICKDCGQPMTEHSDCGYCRAAPLLEAPTPASTEALIAAGDALCCEISRLHYAHAYQAEMMTCTACKALSAWRAAVAALHPAREETKP